MTIGPRTARVVIALVAAATVLAACADDGSVTPGSADGKAADVEVPEGFSVTEVVTGLVGPTQITVLSDGRLVVAQLNGGERDGTGQIVVFDPGAEEEPTVLYDELVAPTGVAVFGDEVWVMEQRRLSSGPLVGGELTTVLDDLPFNGRSEGSLTATDDGRLLYDTSGTLDGVDAAPGSAGLWSIAPGGQPTLVATGFKHAYARTFGPDGTLWETEMSDGTYDGEPAPDELVAVEPGDDFGWPQCIGDGTPVAFYGGTADRCASTPPSQALFPPGSTPTSVAVAPWDPDVLLVALWNDGRVVAVPTEGERPVSVTTFLTGIEHPQTLVSDGDRLLVADFGGGRILAVTAT
ncbi:MAG: glucose sorbosone dehydrogenase [Ilumatobacteraceae bacterium]